jgi:hypothetical protein
MPLPFPNDDTDWNVPVRPMNFLIANRAYRPVQAVEIVQPTVTVTQPTVADQEITVALSNFAVTGDVNLIGNQSSQTVRTFNADASVKETFDDTTAPFDPVVINNFGNQTPANYDVGTTNQSVPNEPRGQWPAVVSVAQNYIVQARQGAFDVGNTIPDRFISANSGAVVFNAGNVNQPIVFTGPAQGGSEPTFTIDAPTSQVGAVHLSTNWRVWQGANNFTPDGSGDNPFTEPVFTNGGTDFNQTFTTGDGLTEWTVPADLVLDPADTDTLYTVGVQCSFTLDGETFWSNWTFNQYIFTSAPELNNVRLLFVGGGGGGAGSGTNNSYGGGGGAGGMLEVVETTLAGDIFTITVAAGGGAQGGGGNDTSMTDSGGTVLFRALGGGAGGGGAGGSGGGGGTAFTASSGGSATQPTSQWGGFGNDGASGTDTSGQCMVGGGGGGAGGAGQQGSGTVNGGTGGTGQNNNFQTGSDIGYCGGGSGGAVGDSNCGFASGTASPGFGGGAGNGGSGTNGLGGGGGGAVNNRDQGNGNPGGPGGSGVVIITYVADQALYSGGTITSYTDDNSDNRIVHTFTTDGTLVPA